MTKENIKLQDKTKYIPNEEALDLLREKVNKELTTAPIIIRQYTQHLAASSGKFIRAASLLVCAQDEDGLIHPHAINFAAAIEIIHLATLVHDDVIDNATTRRGKLTLQNKYGQRTAVICGDYLLCTALKIVADIVDKDGYLNLIVPDYMRRVCLGELNQHINNGFLNLSVYKYLKIISGKTAALFEASFHAGAILCESDHLIISKYMKLGRYIGMIFQMTDDCIDFETTEDVAKKPVQSDYEQGVITLPLIQAFKKLPELKEKASNNKLSRDEINAAVKISGGLSYTKLISKKYYSKAMNIINQLQITSDKRTKLISILNKASRLK